MSTHERAALTTDCARHAATDTVPCWCGATDVKPAGINVLSSLPWTSGGIAYLIEWLGTADRATLRPGARNLSGLLEPLAPEVVAPCDLTEADLLAAWTAADESTREALTAELERRDAADAFDREPAYVSSRETARPSIDAEYAAYLEAEYAAAAHACKAYMVNAAGTARGFTGSDFFKVGRRPSVEKWGSDELRAWFGSGNAVQSDTRGSGHVLSKTEYAAALVAGRELVAA